KRSVLARHGIRHSAAIEGRADPGEIEPREVGAGGWIGTLQEHICCTGLAGGICSSLGHLAMGPYLRVIGGQAQHRQQEESDEDDDNQERLSLLRGPSSQAGAITFHVIEPPFSLPQSCAWLEL